MRRTIRPVIIVFVALLGAIGTAIASAFAAALAYGAVALIVPGTGTPNANIVSGYLAQARDRYLTTTACGKDGSGCTGEYGLKGINYPATFFPLVIFNNWCTPSRCNTWDDSVGQGTATLNTAIDTALKDPTQTVVVFGYSQGGAVVADSLAGHIAGLTDAQKARIQIVTIGGIENPDGGLWQRLSFLKYIPGLNISFNPPMLPSTGINYTSYGFQYDPVVNAPKYFGNPFALVNALAAFENVHGYYLEPNGNDGNTPETLPYGYDDTSLATAIDCSSGTNPNCRKDTYGNSYVTIPALTLPVYNLILGATPAALTPLVQPIVNLLTPVTRLLIDLGYDTSGDPGVPTPLSILPFNPANFNPVDFSVKFAEAIAQGIHDAINGGPTTTLAPSTTTTPAKTSVLAAKFIGQKTDVAKASGSPGAPATVTDFSSKTTTSETTVKEPDTSDALNAAKNAATPTPAITESKMTTVSSTDAIAANAQEKSAGPESGAKDTKMDEVSTGETKTRDVTSKDTKKDEDTKDEAIKVDTKRGANRDIKKGAPAYATKNGPKNAQPKKVDGDAKKDAA